MDALLFAMYTEIPPRRQADYHRVFLLTDRRKQGRRAAREPAHVDLTLKAPRIYVRQHKTARVSGEWSHELPPDLVANIRASLLAQPREHLFTTAVDGVTPFDRVASFAQHHNRALKRWFGPHASNNSLRHAMATHVDQQGVTLRERKEVARAMGHGALMNMAYAFRTKEPKEGGVSEDGSFQTTRAVKGRAVRFTCRPTNVDPKPSPGPLKPLKPPKP